MSNPQASARRTPAGLGRRRVGASRYQRLFATEPADGYAREPVRGRQLCSPPSTDARSASCAARFGLRQRWMIPPTAKPAVILPTHDRLYTIIGRLKRGMSIIALSAADNCGSQSPARRRNSAAGRTCGDERAGTENPHRIDMARTPLRRAMAARNRRIARRAGARDRRRHHPRRQCHRRGRAPGRCRGAGRAAGLGSHALRPARRDPAQGRRR